MCDKENTQDASTIGKAKEGELIQLEALVNQTVLISRWGAGSRPAFPPAEHVGSK